MVVGAFLICNFTKSTITSSMLCQDTSQFLYRHLPEADCPRFCQNIYKMSTLEKARDSSCDNFLDACHTEIKTILLTVKGIFLVFLMLLCLDGNYIAI